MAAGKSSDVPATLSMAQVLLEQGDVWRAEKIYNEILAREPGNSLAQAGLKRCRSMKGTGDANLKEKKLAVLRLLLARLQGAPAAEKKEVDPRRRRLEVLQALLERVRVWRAQAPRLR
jgi:hypothetical protein